MGKDKKDWKTICMDCRTLLSGQRNAKNVSHGCCESCYQKRLKEIEKLEQRNTK